jgi:ferredoxin
MHAEAFGSAGLHRQTDASGDPGPVHLPADKPTPVAFVRSGKEARWNPDRGSLLDLAESRGLSPEFGCRGGSCGTCRTRIVQGAVAYPVAPAFKVAKDEALICCAIPGRAETGGAEHLLLDLCRDTVNV